MNETQRNQLDALNQKVVNGEELNELQRQLRSELSALQQGKSPTFTDDFFFWCDIQLLDFDIILC